MVYFNIGHYFLGEHIYTASTYETPLESWFPKARSSGVSNRAHRQPSSRERAPPLIVNTRHRRGQKYTKLIVRGGFRVGERFPADKKAVNSCLAPPPPIVTTRHRPALLQRLIRSIDYKVGKLIVVQGGYPQAPAHMVGPDSCGLVDNGFW